MKIQFFRRNGFTLVGVLIAVSILSLLSIFMMKSTSYVFRGVAQSRLTTDRDRIIDQITKKAASGANLLRTYQTILGVNPGHMFVRCIDGSAVPGADCVGGSVGELPIYESGSGALAVGTATNAGNVVQPGPVGYTPEGNTCIGGSVTCPIVATATYQTFCGGGAATCLAASDIRVVFTVAQSAAIPQVPGALRPMGSRTITVDIKVDSILNAVTSGLQTCAPGEVALGVDFTQQKVNCKPMRTVGNVGYPAGAMISVGSWGSGASICANPLHKPQLFQMSAECAADYSAVSINYNVSDQGVVHHVFRTANGFGIKFTQCTATDGHLQQSVTLEVDCLVRDASGAVLRN